MQGNPGATAPLRAWRGLGLTEVCLGHSSCPHRGALALSALPTQWSALLHILKAHATITKVNGLTRTIYKSTREGQMPAVHCMPLTLY